MNKKVFKIIISFIFLLVILCISKNVEANSIKSINMDIYIDKNGNAEVTEVWNCKANSGTEIYHPYYNLGNSKITNLRVSDSVRNYTTLQSWNTSGTLSSKQYKCGINKISNGVELCWGISNYGQNIYTVKYNISNFVSQLTDSQMIYWTLIPYDFSNPIGDMKIKIYSDTYFKDTIDVWGYGNYGGLAYVNNGAIYMDSDGSLSTDEYMTILVKLPTGTFNTINELNNNFDYYYELSRENATIYKEKDNSIIESMMKLIISIMNLIFYFFPIIIISVFGSRLSKSKLGGFTYGKEKNKISKDVPYYRDIPCDGNIFKAYFISYYYGIMKKKTDLLGAIILKWLKEGKVKTKQIETGFIRKKMDTAIALLDKNTIFEDSREQELFNMLYEASGDGILEKKEFEKWCKGKYSKILNWFDKIIKEEGQELVNEGSIIETQTKVLGIFKGKIYTVTDSLTSEAINLQGLKKYLKEYTLIHEREAIEVELFENYLIYAQLMGIAKEVAKEFKDLYPDLIEQTNYNSYDNIMFIHYCSASGISSATSARSAAQSYSSGGGGFSSGGGGGGSFGGGGGRWRIPLK